MERFEMKTPLSKFYFIPFLAEKINS